MKPSKPIRFLCPALALGAVLTIGTAAYAQMIPGYSNKVEEYDAREVAMLPRYCHYTQGFRDRVPGGNNPDEIKRWYSVMGEIFNAMHHYCGGLMKTNRAILLARTQQARTFYLSESIGEFNYVIERAPSDFVLMPEILTKKGENLIRLGRAALGIREFERAIEVKPDYWPPYAQLSDYYRDAGDIKKARELLEKGLSLAPDTKALKLRLTELDAAKDKRKAAPQSDKPPKPPKPSSEG